MDNNLFEDLDDGEPPLPDTCPNCHRKYDEIDYEYQICSRCGYNNNPERDLDQESEDKNPNDSRNL